MGPETLEEQQAQQARVWAGVEQQPHSERWERWERWELWERWKLCLRDRLREGRLQEQQKHGQER